MRRVILGVLGTVLGTAVLIGLRMPHGRPAGAVAEAPLDPAAGAGDQGRPAGTPTAGPSSDRPGATKPPARPGGSRPGATTGPATRTRTAAPVTRTILGGAFPARDFGDVQVRVILTGTHIDDIQVVQMSNRPRNAPALLRQEALARQSANLSNVSGATYTCQAYMRSLQSALDRA